MLAIFGSKLGRWWTKSIPAARVSSRRTNPGCAASAAARLGPRSSRIASRRAARKGTAMMARRIAGRGRCNTSQSITSVPRGSDSVPAVNVYVAWTNGRVSVSPMAFQMRFAWPCVDSQCAAQAARQSTPSAGASMKSLLLLSVIALLAACGQSPTAPSTQSGVRQNVLLVPAGAISAARNPSGTGQPGASCQAEPTQPNGFGKDGFANAEAKYAGSDGTPSLANGSSQAVSQYDVACYQLSSK